MQYIGKYLDASEAAYLANWLTTGVLENIAHMTSDGVVYGQPGSKRISRRRVWPKASFITHLVDWNLPPERHFFHPAIATVLKGKVSVLMGETYYTVREGDWMICKPEVQHREYCLANREPFQQIWFLPSPHTELVETHFSSKEGFFFKIYRTPLKPPTRIQQDTESLLADPDQPIELMRSKIARLAIWWLDIIEAASEAVTVHSHPLIDRVQAILEQPDEISLSVSQLADRFGVSPNYLSKMFRRFTGKTLCQTLQNKRIEWAKQYLANSALSVKEIASLLGYSDQQHLCHAFHRFVKVSPTDFRQEVMKKKKR